MLRERAAHRSQAERLGHLLFEAGVQVPDLGMRERSYQPGVDDPNDGRAKLLCHRSNVYLRPDGAGLDPGPDPLLDVALAPLVGSGDHVAEIRIGSDRFKPKRVEGADPLRGVEQEPSVGVNRGVDRVHTRGPVRDGLLQLREPFLADPPDQERPQASL